MALMYDGLPATPLERWRVAIGPLFFGALLGVAWQFVGNLSLRPAPEPRPYSDPRWYSEVPFDNRYYFGVRDSTRALVRRLYKGDTATARARAYFRHMDSAYDPTYIPPALGH